MSSSGTPSTHILWDRSLLPGAPQLPGWPVRPTDPPFSLPIRDYRCASSPQGQILMCSATLFSLGFPCLALYHPAQMSAEHTLQRNHKAGWTVRAENTCCFCREPRCVPHSRVAAHPTGTPVSGDPVPSWPPWASCTHTVHLCT